jgi:DNA-binding PadR family transcriptional regulator
MNRSFVNPELTLFSYEILGLVGHGGAGAHDLLRMARHGRILAWAGESQYYVEPKRLAGLGYLEARKEPGKTRERTVYTLTDKGLDALREYARAPVTVTPVKSDALLRLLICDLVGEEVTRESLATIRDDIADLRARLDESQDRASSYPHRAPYLLLAIDFLRRLSSSYAAAAAVTYTRWWKTSIATSSTPHSVTGGATSYFGSVYRALPHKAAKWSGVARPEGMPTARSSPRTAPQPVP